MRTLRFFWNFITYRKDLLSLTMALSICVAFAELYIPWTVMHAIDSIVNKQDVSDLDNWVLRTLALLVIFYALHAVMIRAEAKLVLESSYNLRRRIYTHIYSQGATFFQKFRTGELIHRVVQDAEIFEEEASDLFSELPFDFFTVIGVTIFMAFLDVKLALLVVVFLIVSGTTAYYLGRPLFGIEKSLQTIGARLAARLQEGITGVRTIQAFKKEDFELASLDKDSRQLRDTELIEGRIESTMEPLADIMELLILVLIVWYGGHLIISGDLTIGGLVAFIAYMEILSQPISEGEGYYRDFQTCRAMADRLQDLLDEEHVLPSGDKRPTLAQLPIEVNDLQFRYPSDKRLVLQDISFSVKPGEAVAITGRNGVGKTTLVDLLLRFHDPIAGTITAGGVDLRDWDLTAWRDSVGVLSQDVFLFHGTIMDNIAYGRRDATRDEVMAAAKATGVDVMVSKFSKSFDTIVGERGARLSGGERQRIALARLFLRQPRVILMDEPTSHLDGEVLNATVEMMRKLMQGSTTLLVTHQAETLQMADRVLFLENGRLAGNSTHALLLAEIPSYAALWKMRGGVYHSMPRRQTLARDNRKKRQPVAQ